MPVFCIAFIHQNVYFIDTIFKGKTPMKSLVLYYSNSGNNRYLAKRFSKSLSCDLEEIKPLAGILPFLIIFSLAGISAGIRKLKHDLKTFDRIIFCGPLWMGRLCSPVKDALLKCRGLSAKLYFATCCGSSDDAKNDKFGYATVFPAIEHLAGEKKVRCEAFPVTMVLSPDKPKDESAVMKAKLSDENFEGRILERLDSFVREITAG
jgi:hypothetical protein